MVVANPAPLNVIVTTDSTAPLTEPEMLYVGVLLPVPPPPPLQPAKKVIKVPNKITLRIFLIDIASLRFKVHKTSFSSQEQRNCTKIYLLSTSF
jgi:hypothetical protein